MAIWIWKDPNDEFMTFKEFVRIHVCQKREYSSHKVQQWLKEYNLSMDSRVVFVRTGHFIDAVRITDGYVLSLSGRSIDGKLIYLFVSNKK